MIKDVADPMFKTMLPGPLSSLHFTKVELGQVPMRFSNAVTTKTETSGIKLDLDVDWDGKCDIELDGNMIPALVGRSLPNNVNVSAKATVLISFARESNMSNSRAGFRSCCVL